MKLKNINLTDRGFSPNKCHSEIITMLKVLTKVVPAITEESQQLLPPATKLGQGYVFTCVCDSVHN